jgi:protein involved in polysaccharide export with SLBB domain
MSSPIHALYSAGGVSNNGSYRNIEVVRGGKVISNLDLYDYFSSGVLQTLFLKDQDVIRVPNYKKRVQLTGEVKFRGLFELRSGETLSDLFEYSGGLGPKALKESFLIERVEGASYKSFNVNAQNEALEPGDKVYVYSISEEKNNTVSIEGEVLIPGSYSLKTIFTVADLIKASKGFTQEAYLEYGSLFRKQPNGVTQMISIGLISDQYNKNLQEPLKENDVLRIYNKSKFFPFEKVRIVGEVISPSTYNFYQGMSLQDLIALAGGLSSSKGKLDITIKSKDPNSNDYIISNSISSYELEKNSSTLLQPDDIVSVILKNNFSATTIKISGEVVNPGVYIESKSLNSITNVIEQAGGFTQFASKDAVYIKRRNNSFEIEKLLDESLSRGSINNEVFFIPVENLNQPYLFEDGDELIVDGYSEDIELVGEVIKPSIVKFKSTKLKYYLAKSGITSKGSKKQILVIYPNKDVSSSSSFLGFNKFPKVKPGSQIVVGKKPERNKISTQELIGITSGLSTLIIVLSTFLSSP